MQVFFGRNAKYSAFFEVPPLFTVQTLKNKRAPLPK